MTILLAVTIFLGWTAFTGDQAAAGQPLNVRTDAHLRGYGPYPPAGHGYAPGPLSPSLSVPLLCSPAVASPPSGFIRPLLLCPAAVSGPLALCASGAPALSLSSGILSSSQKYLKYFWLYEAGMVILRPAIARDEDLEPATGSEILRGVYHAEDREPSRSLS